MKIVLLAILLLGVALPNAAAFKAQFMGELGIESFDGTILKADGFVPVATNATQKFPLVVFGNSWLMPQQEYILKALSWAESGYITLEYDTRGWWRSGGFINSAGPLDHKDAMCVVDYAISRAEEWHLDVDRIALMGISYGAGIGLIAGALDARVKAVVSMSGWAKFLNAFNNFDTPPSDLYKTFFIGGAKLLGHTDGSLEQVWDDVTNHVNMTALANWGQTRAPQNYVKRLNERNIPIFISNNFLDRFFHPQDMLQFFEAITCPKMMILNQGCHAQAEIPGLFGDSSDFPWNEAKMFLDYNFLGDQNGINTQPQVQMQLGSSKTYIGFSSWPAPSVVNQTKFYFGDRGTNSFGTLGSFPCVRSRGGPSPDVISFVKDTGIGTGVPILSDTLAALGFVPETADLSLTNRKGSIVYMTSAFKSNVRLCGEAEINVGIAANAGTWQIFGFLYDVDEFNIGKVLTDSYFTHWENSNSSSNYAPSVFHALCQELPAGHRIAVAITLYHDQYFPANPSSSLQVGLEYGIDTYITLPISIV